MFHHLKLHNYLFIVMTTSLYGSMLIKTEPNQKTQTYTMYTIIIISIY